MIEERTHELGAEMALRESEAKFHALLETAAIAIVIVNSRGIIEVVNKRAEEMFGYAREELLGQMVEILLPEQVREVHIHHRAGYIEQPRVRQMGIGFDLAGRRKDGSEFPVEIGLSYIESTAGVLTMSFITDITERKRAEEALRSYASWRESMHEIDRTILAAQSPQEIAEIALSHLHRMIPFVEATALLFDPDIRRPHVLARVHSEDGLASESFEALQVLDGIDLVRGQEALAEVTERLLQGGQDAVPGTFRDLNIPLIAEEELIGLLCMTTTAEPGFTEEQEAIAREVADQLAIAIQQAQLRDDLERHAAELEERVMERTYEIERRQEVAEGLRDILTTLNSNRPLTEILDYIVALAGRLLGTDATALYHLPQKDSALTIVAARGLSTEYAQQGQIPVGRAAVGLAVQRRAPVAVSDVLSLAPEDEVLYQVPERQEFLNYLAHRYRARLAVPLIVKEEVYGGIVLYYGEPREFSDEEIGLAVAFADQAALAIENARLRSQVEASAVAAERNRLARDLHDAVTQTLFSASLISEVLPRLWETKPDEGKRRLEELRQLTRGALAEMRTLLYELRPAVLVKTDLGDLLRQLAEAATGRARMPVTVTMEEQQPLLPDVQVALYRIAQEALNNVVKHASASRAELRLHARAASGGLMVELTIRDDGRGFDPARVKGENLGLEIMRERAATIGAELTISSEMGQGTEVRVVWQGPGKDEGRERE